MKKVDLILGYFLLALCGIFYFMISKLPEKAILYPIFVTTLLLFLTIIHLAITYLKKSHDEKSGFENLEIRQLFFILGLSGLYVGLIKVVGYVTSTIFYVLVSLLGLKVNKKVSIAVSIGFSIIIYVLFKKFLRVPLPKGFLI